MRKPLSVVHKCCFLYYSVTLGDEQAKRRGVQKSVRERAGPPTFDCCIEMEDRQHWRIYDDVASATDGLLTGVLLYLLALAQPFQTGCASDTVSDIGQGKCCPMLLSLALWLWQICRGPDDFGCSLLTLHFFCIHPLILGGYIK